MAAARVIACLLCRSGDVEIVADTPATLLCKRQRRATAFTITPTPATGAPQASALPIRAKPSCAAARNRDTGVLHGRGPTDELV